MSKRGAKKGKRTLTIFREAAEQLTGKRVGAVVVIDGKNGGSEKPKPAWCSQDERQLADVPALR